MEKGIKHLGILLCYVCRTADVSIIWGKVLSAVLVKKPAIII